MAIRLRFVSGKDDISLAIIMRSQISMPFTPSHVECVTPEGKYLGQHASGGMQARDPDYDKVWLNRELFLDLPSTQEQADAFYAYMMASIGQTYDWSAILDYVLPIDIHVFDHAICSAKQLLGLRTKNCDWFPWPVTVPAHLVSPRDLLLMVSCRVEVPH